ncbi:hypothetical protein [Agromyces marinus]|uniref:Uncharacterized protein n=1 Tax=Agromyces marinus TaxID=1389020 RepID=A0ABM8H5D0_9MICO|nr:hypothetical protein [Agromyces marinus]UIP58995.1 hypothetical protein DSM26151_18860 [Agromyces marinus]BDZ56031.1 hypothetical protein GCM10025870_31040 [Agromyces marinus]
MRTGGKIAIGVGAAPGAPLTGVSVVLFATYSDRDGTLREYSAGTAAAGSEAPAGVDTRFHSASVAAVYGQLVDEATVRFDDPIAATLAPEVLDGLFVVGGVDRFRLASPAPGGAS